LFLFLSIFSYVIYLLFFYIILLLNACVRALYYGRYTNSPRLTEWSIENWFGISRWEPYHLTSGTNMARVWRIGFDASAR